MKLDFKIGIFPGFCALVCLLVLSSAALKADDIFQDRFEVGDQAQAVLSLVPDTLQLALANEPFGVQPVLQVLDRNGDVLSSFNGSVTAELIDGGDAALFGLDAIRADQGVAAFTDLGITQAGSFTLRFSADGVEPVEANVIVVPRRLRLAVEPAEAFANQFFGVQPIIHVVDASDNILTASSDLVTVELIGGEPDALFGVAAVQADQGVAAFTELGITPAGSFTLRFSAEGMTPVEADITVQEPAIGQLVLETPPGDAVADQPFGVQPVIRAVDANNNTLTAAAGSVTASLVGDTDAGLVGAFSESLVEGVAAFTDLGISQAGSYTLRFSAEGMTPVEAGITVQEAALGRLILHILPDQAVADQPFGVQPVIHAVDANDNILTAATGSVTAELVGTADAVLLGAVNEDLVNGVASFTDLGIDRAGTYVLRFTSGGLEPVEVSLDVEEPPPARLIIVRSAGEAVANQAFGVQPVLQVVDGEDNRLTASSAIVTVALANGGGAELFGPEELGAVEGVVEFAGVGITLAGTYTLRFTADGLISTEQEVVVAAGSAATSLAVGRP